MSSTVIPISLFVILSLLIGVIFRRICQKIKFPYTPMILIFGLVWGLIIDYLGLLGDSAQEWSYIDPHAILIIFIPALIYESALGTDFHMFRREIVSILLLAVPGVLISTIITAVALLYVLQYVDMFSWAEAAVLGAILSATDPVAVVALLKELGASKRLSTLVEGESLINDGTAMVVFEVFLSLAHGEDFEPGHVIGLFFRMSFGGLLLGLGFAIIMSQWIIRVHHDVVTHVALTFIFVYLLFWTAEGSGIKVSGILALVAFGLFMSAWGKSYIDTFSEAAVHHWWMMVAWMAETILFVLSGVIIGYQSLAKNHIHGEDWGKLFGLFFLIMLIRLISSIGFYPIMRKVGYGLKWSEYFILIYGGLRGAIGLALALIVANDEEIDEEVRNLILFHTAGIVVLTLLVNGTTTGFFLRKLGLIKRSITSEKLLISVVQNIIEGTQDRIEKLKENQFMQRVDWTKALELSGINKFSEQVAKTTDTGKQIMEKRDGAKIKPGENHEEFMNSFNQLLSADISSVDLVTEFRHRYLKILKGSYWHHYEHGQCSNKILFILLETNDQMLDNEDHPIHDWDIIYKSYTWKCLEAVFDKKAHKHKKGCTDTIKTKLGYLMYAYLYDLVTTYIESHEQALEFLHEITDENETENASLEIVENEAEAQLVKARKFLQEAIIGNFSEISSDIETNKAAFSILMFQLKEIQENKEFGMLEDNDFESMEGILQEQLGKLEINNPSGSLPSFEKIIKTIRFFDDFPKDFLKELVEDCTTRVFKPGDMLWELGDEFKGAYILLSGEVKEIRDTGENQFAFQHSLSTGTIIGANHTIRREQTWGTKAIAINTVYAAFLDVQSIEKLTNFYLQSSEELIFYEKLAKQNCKTIVALYEEKFSEFQGSISHHYISRIIQSSKLKRAQEDDLEVKIGKGAILLVGSLKNTTTDEEFHAIHCVPPSDDKHILAQGSMILKTKYQMRKMMREKSVSIMPVRGVVARRKTKMANLHGKSFNNSGAALTKKQATMPALPELSPDQQSLLPVPVSNIKSAAAATAGNTEEAGKVTPLNPIVEEDKSHHED